MQADPNNEYSQEDIVRSELSMFLKTATRLQYTLHASKIIQLETGTRHIYLQGVPSMVRRKLPSRELIGSRASRLPFAALHVVA